MSRFNKGTSTASLTSPFSKRSGHALITTRHFRERVTHTKTVSVTGLEQVVRREWTGRSQHPRKWAQWLNAQRGHLSDMEHAEKHIAELGLTLPGSNLDYISNMCSLGPYFNINLEKDPVFAITVSVDTCNQLSHILRNDLKVRSHVMMKEGIFLPGRFPDPLPEAVRKPQLALLRYFKVEGWKMQVQCLSTSADAEIYSLKFIE